MSTFARLLTLAARREELALIDWQRLDTECTATRHKLSALEGHGAAYYERLAAGLRQGAAAASAAAHLAFVAQIEAVAARQSVELDQLEAACAQHWHELLSSRRDRRTYEILVERQSSVAVERTRRMRQAALAELVLRAGARRQNTAAATGSGEPDGGTA